MKSEENFFFDKEEMLNRLGNNEELCRELIALTPKHFSKLLENLKIALDEKDAESVRLHSHTAKGMMGNAASPILCGTAYEIQAAGEEGDLDKARILFEKLEEQFDLFLSALQECGWLTP